MTCNIGLSTVFPSFNALLIKKGLSIEIISSIYTVLTPLNFLAAILASKFIRPNKQMDVWRIIFFMQIVESFAGYLIIMFNSKIDETN